MKTIGIKLADGSFYPVLEEGTAKSYQLDLTTVKDGQTKVQIDLYRSESGTMDDAEYVDTLEVSNLVPHPNGEADLHLSLSLNEQNELDAKVVDEETGKQSETSVTLVSRTLAERSEPTNFELSDSANDFEETAEPDVVDVVSDSELADEPADDSIKTENVDLSEFGFSADDDENTEAVSAPVESSQDVEDVPFTFDSELEKENAEPVDVAAEEVTDDAVPAENADITEDTTIADDGESDIKEEALPEIDEQMFDTSSFTTDAADSSDFQDSAETDGIVYKTGAETSEDSSGTTNFIDPTQSVEDEPAADETVTEETASDETIAADVSDSFADTTVADNSETVADTSDEQSFDSSDFELPDFDSFDTTETDSSAIDTIPEDPVEKETDTQGLTGYFDDPDFKDDPVFNEPDLNTSSNPAMDFSDLYDKETLDGKTANYEDEEEKKTRTPVIICIVCAIICIIATILVLFVVPSKYNLLNGKKSAEENAAEQTEAVAEQPAPEEIEIPLETEPELVVEAPQAEEDKIVVAEELEVVVPVPQPAPEPEKAKDVKYRIRWGDTLWDIADAYYKNPWRYPKIARYNKIKNPDVIISGTDILIPVE